MLTQYWVDYSFAEYNDPQFWYIVYDESILDILGEPIDFEVIQNVDNNNNADNNL